MTRADTELVNMNLLTLGQREIEGSVGVEILVEILRRSYTRAPLTSLSRSFFVHPSKSIEFLMSTGSGREWSSTLAQQWRM